MKKLNTILSLILEISSQVFLKTFIPLQKQFKKQHTMDLRNTLHSRLGNCNELLSKKVTPQSSKMNFFLECFTFNGAFRYKTIKIFCFLFIFQFINFTLYSHEKVNNKIINECGHSSNSLNRISEACPGGDGHPCLATRWTKGDGWEDINGCAGCSTNGVIACASAAATQSNIGPNTTYCSSSFALPSLSNCINPDTQQPISLTGPSDGQPILWFNFDVRALAATSEFQIIGGPDNIGWALFYTNNPTEHDLNNGLSGDCNDLSYDQCGSNFTGWADAAFEVPAFPEATNYYLMVWDQDPTSGYDFSINFKARFGCGDGEFCTLEQSGTEVVECNTDGTYSVTVNFNGINGVYEGVDNTNTPGVVIGPDVCLTNIGDTPADVSGSITFIYPEGTAYDIGIRRATDCFGNTVVNPSECNFTTSGVAPCTVYTIPSNVQTDVSCAPENANSIIPPSVTDGCGEELDVTGPTGPTGAFDGCSGLRIYTWTYMPCVGASFDWIYTFNVLGETDIPEILDIADYSLTSCNEAWPTALSTTWTDNCAAGGTITSDGGGAITTSTDGCSQSRVYTFTVTDDCGNTDTETTTVTRDFDETNPEIICPVDITIDCANGSIDPVDTGIATATDNCSDVTPTYEDEPIDVNEDCQLRTQTQGGWGTSANGNNPGVYRDANFDGAFPGGLTIGCDYTLTLTSSQAVEDFLPDGGPSSAISMNYVDPNSIGNTFASQLTAITLSLGFDNYDPNFGLSEAGLGDAIMNSGTFSGMSVNEIVAIANDVFGGCSTTYSPNQMNSVLSTINENYVDGNTNNGNLDCANSQCSYSFTRIWTATDDCGNIDTCHQIITIEDNTLPVFNEMPPHITITCGMDIPSIPVITASDNCSIDPLEVIYNQEQVNYSCGENEDVEYILIRKWSTIDACGNMNEHIQTVTINRCEPCETECIENPICSMPIPSNPDCDAPSSFDYVSVADGSWMSPSTWLNGDIPTLSSSTGSIYDAKIKIEHNVYIPTNNLKLRGASILYVVGSGSSLTVKDGAIFLYDDDTKAIFLNTLLQTYGSVYQHENTFVCMTDVELWVGEEEAGPDFIPGVNSTSAEFVNEWGYRWLDNVCGNVTKNYKNIGGSDFIIGSCLDIGDRGETDKEIDVPEDNGYFLNEEGVMKIWNSEVYITCGDVVNSDVLYICGVDFRLTHGNFVNDSGGSSIEGEDLVIWINNNSYGNIINESDWDGSTITLWRIDNGNTPDGIDNLPNEASSASIAGCFGCSCTTTGEVITLIATVTQISCFGETGSVILSSNGTPPLTYDPDNPDLTGLTPGMYTYNVVDADGNSATTTVTINVEPTLMALTSAAVTSPIGCDGLATVTIVAEGGTAPHYYTFNNDTNTSGVFTGVSAGTDLPYSITDANGCEPVIGMITITEACTFTQGAWGNPNGAPGTITNTTDLLLIQQLIDANGGSLTIGLPGQSLTVESAECVLLLLPGAGGPKPLSSGDWTAGNGNGCDAGDPNNNNSNKQSGSGRLKNRLATHAIALQLNIWYNEEINGIEFGNYDLSTGCPDIGIDLASYGFTVDVNGLLDFANAVLAGDIPNAAGAAKSAIAKVNKFWDNCMTAESRSQLIGNESNQLGEETTKNAFDYQIHPNPVVDDNVVLTINTTTEEEDLKVKVFNIQGTLIFEYTLQVNEGINESTIDVSEFQYGVYFISIYRDGHNKSITKRFIKLLK